MSFSFFEQSLTPSLSLLQRERVKALNAIHVFGKVAERKNRPEQQDHPTHEELQHQKSSTGHSAKEICELPETSSLAPSKGERVRVRGFLRLSVPRSFIITMRRTRLQQLPNGCFNYIQLISELVIPKTFHVNAFEFQKRVALSVSFWRKRITVSKAVQFDVQSRFRTIEIQNVALDRVLPTKFVTCKSSTAQQLPKLLFSPCRAFSQGARYGRKLHKGVFAKCELQAQADFDRSLRRCS